MKYFMPDSQDLVDPSFDFERERRAVLRQRQQDDLYVHEVFAERVIDGVLVSKGIVDGSEATGGRFSMAQRQRLLRVGAREFLRLDRGGKANIETMGDCGAFTYIREKVPPYTVDEVLDFYLDGGFDYGISVDHIILPFSVEWDRKGVVVSDELRERQEITLDLAREFLHRCQSGRLPIKPLGVAQGWSPKSYARATMQLQKIGYRHIAVGGMVPLKTHEIISGLAAISEVRNPATQLHLLGITRAEKLREFAKFGVTSFDSTSPLRQAFKDDKDNYYTPSRTYLAVRVPQVEGNPRLQKLISSGKVSQDKARTLERECMDAMRGLDAGQIQVVRVMDALKRYDDLCGTTSDYAEAYRDVLTDRPWKACRCDVCRKLGYHVILFRGAERNRRRGFHNTWVFYRYFVNPEGIKAEARPSDQQATPTVDKTSSS